MDGITFVPAFGLHQSSQDAQVGNAVWLQYEPAEQLSAYVERHARGVARCLRKIFARHHALYKYVNSEDPPTRGQ